MQSLSAVLLDNADATGPTVTWQGGRARLTAVGTFGGGAVNLEFLGPDNSTWIPYDATGLTAAGSIVIETIPGSIRASVAGGTPSALFARIDRVPD